jgi:hypothetical protein
MAGVRIPAGTRDSSLLHYVFCAFFFCFISATNPANHIQPFIEQVDVMKLFNIESFLATMYSL